jgi:hypothetical protein
MRQRRRAEKWLLPLYLFSVFALSERKNGKQKRGKYRSAESKTPTA